MLESICSINLYLFFLLSATMEHYKIDKQKLYCRSKYPGRKLGFIYNPEKPIEIITPNFFLFLFF